MTKEILIGKNVLKAIFISIIAIVSVLNVFEISKKEFMSEIMIRNLESLANLESDKPSIPGTYNTDCDVYCQIDARYDCFMLFLDGMELRCHGYRKK